MALLNSPQKLVEFRQKLAANRDKETPCVSICAGSGCLANGTTELIKAFEVEIEDQGLSGKVDTKRTGCHG
ncbi:MAG: (2Fe-2S) ferredoxin domain-containing protein, partial [bacterium]